MNFIDTDSFGQYQGTKKQWSAYREFSSLRKYKNFHYLNAECLDTLKIRFVSDNDKLTTNQRYHSFFYSPLIKLNDGYYKIYEQKISRPCGFFYSYIFKRVGDSFEFVERSYHADVIYTEEDYMKTIDFSKPYEKFMENRK